MHPRQQLDQLILTHADDPGALRDQWALRLHEVFDVEHSSHYDARVDPDGRVQMSNTRFLGNPAFEAHGEDCDGDVLSDTADILENMATLDTATVMHDSMFPPAFVERYWASEGIHSAVAISAADSGRFCGILNVFRAGDAPAFPSDAAQGERRPWVKESLRMLRVTDLMRLGQDAGVGHSCFVLRPDGSPWMATDGEPLRPELVAAAKDFWDGGAPSAERTTSAWRARLSRLEGDDEAMLVMVDPMIPVELPEIANLTWSQRRVAAMASRGLTVPEIARIVQRSSETVRSHLKAIYEHLGIGSRAELAEIWHSL